MNGKGIFITLEGGEGSGKTTQIQRLAKSLQVEGYDVVTTREPGGTVEAEKIRDLLVQRDGGDWTPEAECLLLFAARVMHVETLIKPSLAQGKIVISDRFTDSTRAYQSYGHGLDQQFVEDLNETALGGFSPHRTFIMDLPVEIGLERSGKQNQSAGEASKEFTEDRFENMETSFHEKLRQGYLDIARNEPERCIVINAAESMDVIADALKAGVMEVIHG